MLLLLPRYVGDAFVDSGVAVLENRIQKDCADFSDADLAVQADELERIYANKAWIGYLTVHFPNSGWCNATTGEDKKRAFREKVLRSHDAPVIEDRVCTYCRRSAQHLADRSMIPLLTGETTMTCSPGGLPGLPVCGACLGAIQFYPLAAQKIAGKPLFWWIPQSEWMYSLTQDFSSQLARMMQGQPDKLESIKFPHTRLLESLERVLEKVDPELPAQDLMACHATNYGSGPDYDEIRVPTQTIRFLRQARRYPAFSVLLAEAREKSKAKKGEPAELVTLGRNFFYEGLLAYERGSNPQALRGLLKRHFIPLVRNREQGAMELTKLFCREILQMDQTQLNAIFSLADQIAGSGKAAKHLDRLFKANSTYQVIRTLTEIAIRMKNGGESPLTTSVVLEAFGLATEDDQPNRDALTAHQLLLLRLIEQLPTDRLPEPDQIETAKKEE